MNSSNSGISTLDCRVTDINGLGLFVLVQGKEYFIPFREYPRLLHSKVSELTNVIFLPPYQLRWEDLDVDIEIQALEQPENFPLIFR